MMNKINVAAVVGPTASGKTSLAVQLAKKHSGEVVSADSMQIYKNIPVATAQPDENEKCGVPHHLIAFRELSQPFSVAEYITLANRTISEIHDRGNLPVIAGGTGLYVSSLLDGTKFAPVAVDDELRKELYERYATDGGEKMLAELKKIDPPTAVRLFPADRHRIIRAFEIYLRSGTVPSVYEAESHCAERPYDDCIIGLDYKDRADLYDRVNRRAELMLENGILDEARSVMEHENVKTAHQAIGCKEFFPYLRGEASLAECLEALQRSTRRYAKRQLTWFRHQNNINWIYLEKDTPAEEIFEKAEIILEKSGII